ncbi:MAG TPA: hypothetical protein VFB31_04225 [Pseudolabrys sp.]|nr:hypothetical protein [Pseudolabrys sp.]
MPYAAYVIAAIPLLLLRLAWTSVTTVAPPRAPRIQAFDEDLHQVDVLRERLLADIAAAQTAPQIGAS